MLEILVFHLIKSSNHKPSFVSLNSSIFPEFDFENPFRANSPLSFWEEQLSPRYHYLQELIAPFPWVRPISDHVELFVMLLIARTLNKEARYSGLRSWRSSDLNKGCRTFYVGVEEVTWQAKSCIQEGGCEIQLLLLTGKRTVHSSRAVCVLSSYLSSHFALYFCLYQSEYPCILKHWPEVINHGVRTLLLETFKSEVIKFFQLPTEEKKKLWQQPDNHEGFGQLFVVSEDQKLDWSDMFYITTLPPNLRRPELFDKLPHQIREVMEAYIAAMKELALTLLNEMAKALGMDQIEMAELFSNGVQSIRMNYYPPCPEPGKAIGFTPHSDADAITILFQLNDTQGLQIRKDGHWVSVEPLPNAFVVNVGDIMEIVSNGVYRSIEHRATVNLAKERLSVATFYSSNLDSELGPAGSIIGPHNPPRFRREPTEQYFKGFFARKLNGKSYLEVMRLEQGESNTI